MDTQLHTGLTSLEAVQCNECLATNPLHLGWVILLTPKKQSEQFGAETIFQVGPTVPPDSGGKRSLTGNSEQTIIVQSCSRKE